MSRLPDSYQLQTLGSMTPENSSEALRGDVKTVLYFVAGNTNSSMAAASFVQVEGTGLVRGEMDRATAIYATEHGGLDSQTVRSELLAPEVAGIAFQYYNGTEWTDTWDSSQNGGLPTLVRVTLYIKPIKSQKTRPATSGNATNDASNEQPLPYSLLVQLPMAQAGASTDNSDTEAQSSTTSGGTSQ